MFKSKMNNKFGFLIILFIIISVVYSCPVITNDDEDNGNKTKQKNNKERSFYYYNKDSISFFDADGDSLSKSLYESWKTSYVTDDGASGYLRVVDFEKSGATVSEGMGYGMLLAVYFNDKDTFDDLFEYVKLYLNENGLMKWQINSSGIPQDNGAATDADVDIALSLIFADKIWGNYKADALAMLSSIIRHEIEDDGLLKPGDSWGETYPYNPSYITPAWYKVFKLYTGDLFWDRVLDRNYDFLSCAQHPVTGLFPDWCNVDGSMYPSKGYNYSYDACRVPWRLIADYLWFRDNRALDLLKKMGVFIENTGIHNLKSGYSLDGTSTVSYIDSAFSGPFACVSMISDFNWEFQVKMYDLMKRTSAINYYNSTLKTLCSLIVSGNFPCLIFDSLPVFNTDMPPYVVNETNEFGKLFGSGMGIDPAVDVLKRPDFIVWDDDYDVSYHDDYDGVKYITLFLKESATVYSLILDNLNESNTPSPYNRLYRLRILAVKNDGSSEYVYDNNGLGEIGYGYNICIPFIKPVNAKALRIELTDSRYRCHVRMNAVNKVDFPPEIKNISHTAAGSTYNINIDVDNIDDPATTSVYQKSGDPVLINKTNEKKYYFDLTVSGEYIFEVRANDGTTTISEDYTIIVP